MKFLKQSELYSLLNSNPKNLKVYFEELPSNINGQPFIKVERPFSQDIYADNRTYKDIDRIYIKIYSKNIIDHRELVKWLKTHFNFQPFFEREADYYMCRCEMTLGVVWDV